MDNDHFNVWICLWYNLRRKSYNNLIFTDKELEQRLHVYLIKYLIIFHLTKRLRMQLFTLVFLCTLLTLVKSLAVHTDEYHYVNALEAKVDDLSSKLEILEDFIKHQNEVINLQDKRITVLEDIVLEQRTNFNQEVTSKQNKLNGYITKLRLGNTQDDDILHQKNGKEDRLKDIVSMRKISKATKKRNNNKRMDIDTKEKSFIDAATAERNRDDTKEGIVSFFIHLLSKQRVKPSNLPSLSACMRARARACARVC